MLALAAGTHVFWITSRAAGVLALLLASLSVCVGLTTGGRLLRRGTRDLRILHEALSLAALVALVVHALSLLGDAYLRPSLADLTIPFAGSFGEPWLAIGIVAGWATLLLGASYHVRGRIGVQRWRRLHRFTALAWLLSLVHALGEGTDAGTAWFLLATGIVAAPAATLLVVRLTQRPAAPAAPMDPAVPARSAGSSAPSQRPSASRLWSGA
ncbi:MAG TPA: ferric reductase-like transmembrane domain-containing protein [Conexibacter sp.]|jgi:sulfoxide reductase heme-binding subunit YedZ|nr:ferric reductase-like transmembrane domain-containing protein [Conexibacter sp.]